MKRLIGTLACVGLAIGGVAASILAQNPSSPLPAPSRVDEDSAPSPVEQRYALFTTQAKELELALKRGEQALILRQRPLQTFSSEGHTFGSVYLWRTADRRPAVIGTIGSIPINGNDFGFIELHWLLNEPIRPLTVGTAYPKRWETDGNQVVVEEVRGAPIPAETATARLVQMRGLARAFSAQMSHRDTRHKLRLLPQPLYRYDEHSQDRDGAIFAFVWTIGTDPEVLLHLQALTREGETRWYWQPIRFTWRAVELAYNQQEVWQAEEFSARNQPLQTGPYLTTLTERIP